MYSADDMGNAVWAHCGDSRLYWMREGHILARTRDHSRIETLIAQGKVGHFGLSEPA